MNILSVLKLSIIMLNHIECGPERGSAITGRITISILKDYGEICMLAVSLFFTLSSTHLKILYRAQQIPKSALDHWSL